jgi:outer membrane immunogenic protein
MKKLLLATTAIATLAAGAPAMAADMAVKAARPLPPPCAAAQFAGGYIGINGGGVNWTANRTDLDGAVNSDLTLVQKRWGGTVGGQIGYNWTTCNTVWGIELDGNWIGAKVNTRLFPNTHLGEIGVESKLDALVTGRLRTGIVMDNLLLYVTGGIAAAHTKTRWFHDDAPVFRSVEFSEWRWGWVAGFGTEWAWSPNVSIKSEVLYVDVADRNQQAQFFTPPATPSAFTHSDSLWVSRIGLNVRFGGGPVAARY